MAKPDLQRYSWNLFLINNIEEFVVLKKRNEQAPFVKKLKLKIMSFQNYENLYLIHAWSDKTYKVVNRSLPSLHFIDLKIRLQSL